MHLYQTKVLINILIDRVHQNLRMPYWLRTILIYPGIQRCDIFVAYFLSLLHAVSPVLPQKKPSLGFKGSVHVIFITTSFNSLFVFIFALKTHSYFSTTL